jgi:tripartite ATP-independent transporter DctM subunit
VVRALDEGFSRLTEFVAASLLVVEVVLLAVTTTARYAFGHPYPWSDELATYVFEWLSVLGAVVALRRGAHMRLTVLVRGMRPQRRAWLDAIAMMLVATVLLALVLPAWEHYQQLSEGLSPVMQISEGWRGAAMIVGVMLMLITAVQNLVRVASGRQILLALVLVGAALGLLQWFAPTLQDMGNSNLVLFFVVFVIGSMVIGMPIAFAFLLGTIGYVGFATQIPVSIVPDRMDEGMSHIILLAVPLFVFLGALIEMAGLARAMIQFMVALIGHLRGGLQYVLLGAMYLVSGISGAKAADMAAVAPALFPEMIKRGARPGDLVALLSATGAQTETVPPSLVLITIGSVTGVSISALFTGGLLPSIVLAAALCFVVRQRNRNEDLSHIRRATAGEVWRALLASLPALALPFVIRFMVVEGVATATEVSTIGIAYTVVIGLLVYRQFDWSRLLPMLVETASLSGAILLIVGAATSMAWALTQSGFSQQLADLMAVLPGGRFTFLAASIVAFVVLGSVLEGIPVIVLFGPLLFPIAQKMGVHEVHYAMVTVLAMGIGLFAPPFGVGFYAAAAIGRVNPNLGIGPFMGYLLAMLLGLAVVAAVPWISIGFL